MLDLTLKGAYRRTTIDRKTHALEQLSRSVVQIYATVDRGERRIPASAGTGTLIQIAGKRFLITAAHVLDEAKNASLYLGVDGVLVAVDGAAFTTAAADRATDLFDFGFMEIKGELLIKTANCEFISKDRFFYGEGESPLTVYMALGFPRSKNKKINIPGRKVKNKRWSFTSRKKPSFDYGLTKAEPPASPDTHIAVDFKQRGFVNESGAQVNPFSPKGMSGGPLLKLGNAGNPNYYARVKQPATLSGILIEEHQDQEAVLAVRLATILKEIAKVFPEVSAELPGQLALA